MSSTGITPHRASASVDETMPDPEDDELLDARGQAKLTLRLFLQLVLFGVPAIGLLALVHAGVLAAAVAIAAGLFLVLSFPSPKGASWAGIALVLAPDLVVVGHLGGSPLSLRSVVFFTVGALALLACMRGRLEFTIPSPLVLGILCVATILGSVTAGRTGSLAEFAVLTILPPVTGAIIGTDRRTAAAFLRGLTAGAAVVMILALFEALSDHNYLVTADAAASFVRAGHIRTTAGWDYPTTLAAFLCLAGFFVVQTLRNRWGLVGLAIGGTLVSAALVSTQARSGLLGFAVGAVVYLLLQRRASQGLGVLVGLGVVIGLLFTLPGAAPESFRRFTSESFTPGSAANSNVHYRQELYTHAKAAVAEHPWVGFGYGSGKSVATNALAPFFGDQTDLASLPVSLAVQVGLLGTAAVFLFLLVVVVRLARSRDAFARVPLTAGIVACFVAMLGVPVTPPLSCMLLLAGMGWRLTRPPYEVADRTHR